MLHDLHCLQSPNCSIKDLFDFQLLIIASNDFTSLNVAELKAERVENQLLRITGNLYMDSTIIIFSSTLSLYRITFLSISFILSNLHLIFFFYLKFLVLLDYGLLPKFQHILCNIFISLFSWFLVYLCEVVCSVDYPLITECLQLHFLLPFTLPEHFRLHSFQ